MSVVVFGLNHRSAPVEVRERYAIAEACVPDALARLRDGGLAAESVILSTCNRIELYVVTPLPVGEARCALKRLLADTSRHPPPPDDAVYCLAEPDSLRHLFRVACGLDSMLLGETEILGQLKRAYALALQAGHTGGLLNKAFQRAFHVAKHVRTDTNIQRGSVSVAAAAVELAEKIFDRLDARRVMVVGAGDTGEKTARALQSRGATDLIVTNRSLERAQTLAAALGGRAVPFEDWGREFERVDILISSTAAPGYVLDRARLLPLTRPRRGRPLLLIDIAVPRDIDPDVNALDNVFLYDIDDLQAIADDSLRQREAEVVFCERIIAEKVRALLGERSRQPAPAPAVPVRAPLATPQPGPS